MYSILATAHDYEFTGTKLDQVLIDHFSKEFIKWNKTDPREIPRSLAKLTLEAEATKKALSLGANASINIESLAEGVDFTSTINRTRYEILASKIFAGFTRLIEGAVKKADLDILDIDEVSYLTPALPSGCPTNHPQVILSGGTSHTPKIATNILSLFPRTTSILSPTTSSTALNPSDLSARGAAIQASLIQEFDLEDISQSAHPMVTVTPHLQHTIGVLVLSESPDRGIFKPVLLAETAVPARRTVVFASPKEGGDVMIKICEGVRGIKVSKAAAAKKAVNGDAESENDSEEEEEEEELREKIWKVGRVLAEAAVRDVKKGAKVEVVVHVSGDLGVQISAREVAGKGGVRGALEGRK